MKVTEMQDRAKLKRKERKKKKLIFNTNFHETVSELSKASLKKRPVLAKASLKENGVQEK